MTYFAKECKGNNCASSDRGPKRPYTPVSCTLLPLLSEQGQAGLLADETPCGADMSPTSHDHLSSASF